MNGQIQQTFGSFKTLGILKEAMVDILTLRGIEVAVCKQRLRGERLLRLLAAIEERNASWWRGM